MCSLRSSSLLDINIQGDFSRFEVDLDISCYRFEIIIFYFFQGEQGVTKVLQMLRDELKVAMALAGLT